MHRFPNRRRFGAPEVLLILSALAIIVPLTAWWHAFCQPDEPFSPVSRAETACPAINAAVPPDASAFTVVGYYYPSDARGVFADFAAWKSDGTTTRSLDINTLLLFGLSVIGIIVACFYSISVYPGLRAIPRNRWV